MSNKIFNFFLDGAVNIACKSIYSEVSNNGAATPIYLGFFSKKFIKYLRRDFLCSAQKVLCNNRHAYTIRHVYSIPQSIK